MTIRSGDYLRVDYPNHPDEKWGYYLLKFVVYILFLSFPIGTVISYSSLKYMKKNNVKELYQKWI